MDSLKIQTAPLVLLIFMVSQQMISLPESDLVLGLGQDFMERPAEKVVKGQVQVVEGMSNINTYYLL